MAKFVPFIIKTDGSQNISVKIVRMKKSDAVQTEKEPVWQTSWLSDYIQDDAFEKYALKTSNGELVAHAPGHIQTYTRLVPQFHMLGVTSGAATVLNFKLADMVKR